MSTVSASRVSPKLVFLSCSRPFIYILTFPGSCRVKDGVTSCESHGPRINWVSQLEADITAANVSDSQGVILDRCVKTLNERGPDHSFTSRLATAMFALLVISTILNVSGIIAAVFYGSGFAKPIFIIGLIDEMILVTCIGIFLGLLNHEVGKYIPATVALRDIDDKAILGVGFWMLIAAFGARAISHPLLFLITLVVALLVVLVPISLLLACCLGSDRRKQTVEDVQRRIIFVFRVTDSPRDSRW